MTTTTLLTPAASSTSPSSPALLFDDAITDTVTHVVVHPLVLLHVLDHHTRRQDASGRVIGTLLGRRDGRTVEVTNCFAVPHVERGDEVAFGKDFNKQMLALHLRANRKEVVVGWYASAALGGGVEEEEDEEVQQQQQQQGVDLIADTSSLIHEFYAGESDEGDPIHLVIDTRLLEDSISVRAYRSTPVTVQGDPLANLFHELHLTLECNEPETICLNQMIGKSKTTTTSTDDEKKDDNTESITKDPLEVSMELLYQYLETATNYVDSVVEGRIVPDSEVGRQIADTLATVPRIRPEVFDRLFNDSLQDLLMVTYLSNITRTQLEIAEKLNATLGV